MKKKSLLLILVILILVGIGSSLAYFNSTAILENIFEAGTYKTVTHEEFISPTNWKPGDTTPKTITTKNEGTIPVRIRVKLEESWTSKNNDNLNLTFNNEDVSIINYSSMDKWIYEDGYFYYDGELAPGDTTSSLLESITFNPNIPSSVLCTKNAEGTREVCESTGDGYDDATYKLNITTETVQANKYLTVWGLDHPIEKYAFFDEGRSLNAKLFELTGDTTDPNVTITSFLKATSVPDNSVLNDEHLVSSKLSNYPIYAWFDNGVIYWWCEREPYFNENSSSIFAHLSSLTDIFGVADINTTKVKDFSRLFADAISLSNFTPIAEWDVSNVETLNRLFYSCDSLTSLTMLEDWDTSKVKDMMGMLYECFVLTTLSGLENWDTSNVEDLSYVFAYDHSLNDISQLENWNTGKVTTFKDLFCTTYDLVDFTGVANWDTSNVVNMHFAFGMGRSDGKNNSPIIDFSPISNWDVSNVTDMGAMFQNINIVSYEAFSNWNVGKVQDFSNCFNSTGNSTVTTLHGLENWNVSSAVQMQNMFFDHSKLTDASAINNWDVRKVRTFSRMFGSSTVHPDFTMVTGTWNNGTFTKTG